MKLLPTAKLPTPRKLTRSATRAALCEEFARLRGDGLSLSGAARALGRSPSMFSGADSMARRFERGGIAALEPRTREGTVESDLSRRIEALEWFIPAASFFYFTARRRRGALRLAVTRAAALPRLPLGWSNTTRQNFKTWLWLPQLPECPADLRRALRKRERQRRAIVPARIERAITCAPSRLGSYAFELPVRDLCGRELATIARRLTELRPDGVCRVSIEVL